MNKNNVSINKEELAALIARVRTNLDELNKYDELPNVRYNDVSARELYEKAADGYFPNSDVDSTTCEINCEEIKKIYKNAKSVLAKAAALNVYKKARAAMHSESYDAALRDELFAVLEDIKNENRNYGEPYDVVGSSAEPNGWIYGYENGPMVREVCVKSKKQGMKPLEIVQFTDVHFNYCNEDDISEANPTLMSTLEHRRWLGNAESLPTARAAMEYAAMSDQTVVTGDILDYLSLGAQELTQKELFWRDPNMLACIGGHEASQQMQGVVSETKTMKEKYDMLASFWCHDIFYESKLLGDRVIAVVLDNGSIWRYHYTELQYNKLKSDIEYARQNDLIILIFEHEQICTSNPTEECADIIRVGDARVSKNFYKDFAGGEATTDEWTLKTYDLIRQSSDVIKGVFCGHMHNDVYTEILGTDGGRIPQYVLTANPYDATSHVLEITVE